jgi:hypothetical protein
MAPTIDELSERGVSDAGVVCRSCARLFSVSFRMMFLHGETRYVDIPRHRDFRCPCCDATDTVLLPLAEECALTASSQP